MGVGNLVMTTEVDIEVVMAVYNGINYLEQQILSIYQQTLRPKKLLVRDDCSSDGSLELLKSLSRKWPGWIEIMDSNERVGAAANFGKLLRNSRSPYVALADQDDLWDANKLEVCYQLCRRLEMKIGIDVPVLIHSDLRIIDDIGRHLSDSFFEYQGFDPYRTDVDELLIQNIVTGCSSLVNRSLLNRALPLPDHPVMHDLWLALVASEFGSIGFIPQPLLSYRQHRTNVIGASGLGLSYLLKRVPEIFSFNIWKRLIYISY